MKYLQIFLCLLAGEICFCVASESVQNSTPPACSSLQEEEIIGGTLCRNGTKTKKKRDKVLEKLVAQAWRAIDVGLRLSLFKKVFLKV